MQRVIIHTPESGLGGARYVYELVMALASQDAPVVLFCPANFEYLSDVGNAGVEVAVAAARQTSFDSLSARVLRNVRFVAQAASAQVRLTRPGDVVHFQFLIHLPLGFLFVLLARLKGAGVVLTAHDPLPHKWRFPSFLRGFEHGMRHWLYSLCDRIIVHNKAGEEVLLSEFGVPSERIFVIPHGPLSEAPPGAPFPDSDRLRLLVFGGIRENKGIHLAIQATQTANAESCVPVRLTIAGVPQNAGESRYWEECKRLAARTPNDIEVIERFIPNEEVGPLLARHHAVLLPYVDFSSESGVAALSFANGRPILATRAGGLGELLEQSKGGIFIESATVDSVTRVILNAVEAGFEELRKMGVNGQQFVTAKRSWASIARKTIPVYLQLAEAAEGGQPLSARDFPSAPGIVSQEKGDPGTDNAIAHKLPSFLIIGPPRTGTTWVHEVLKGRALLPDKKETCFFDKNFHKGLDWYRGRFSDLGAVGPMGEIAPTYFVSAAARKRISRTIPEVKIVCILRNPVDRVWSLYRLKRAYALISWSFEEAMVRDPELIETGRYATHLKAWRKALGEDQVLTIMYDDLRSDPQSCMDALANFIGVPRFQLAESQLGHVYSVEGKKMTYPRHHTVMRIARAAANRLLDLRLKRVVAAISNLPLTRKLLKGGAAFEVLDPDVATRVRKQFRPEVEELEAMLNRDLSAWK